MARELTDYETTCEKALLPLGFTYHPADSGGGYYWHKDGIQLTDDLQFGDRYCRRVWTLKRIAGLLIYERTFPQTKRRDDRVAEEIAARLKKVFDKPDWLKKLPENWKSEGWTLTDLGE